MLVFAFTFKQSNIKHTILFIKRKNRKKSAWIQIKYSKFKVVNKIPTDIQNCKMKKHANI